MSKPRFAFRAVTIILYWTVFAALCLAQAAPSPIVRIVAYEGSGASEGSGTVAWDNGAYSIIHTAAHVVRDSQRLLVKFSNGKGAFALVVNIDIPRDLAAILIRTTEHVTPIEPGQYRGGAVVVG